MFFIPIYLEFIHLLTQRHYTLPLVDITDNLFWLVLVRLMKLLDFIFELMLARQCLNYSVALTVSAKLDTKCVTSHCGTGFLFMKFF